MSLHTLAQHLQNAGRGEDKVLVHMTPKEVSGLQSLAMAHGGSLSVNPKTGLPEAGFLSTILPIAAGAMLGPAGIGLSAMQAAAVTGIAGAAMTGSLGKGLMMGLGAYGGAGLGEGLMAAGAAGAAAPTIPVQSVAPSAVNAGTSAATNLGSGFTNMAPDLLANPVTSATGGAGINVVQPTTSSFIPATTEATGTSIFDKFSQAGRGLGNIFGGGPEGEQAREKFAGQISKPQMYGMGISALMAARQEQQEEFERQQRAANRPTGPFKPTYTFDSGYNPAAPAQGLSGERQYFNPQYTPIRYADGGGVMASPQMGGGPVEQMSTLNAIGANTRYPMANLTNAKYATAAQRPISENVLTPMTNYNIDPYSGDQRFAGGGLAELAHFAAGGSTMTYAQAVNAAKSQGISLSGIGRQGLANALGTTITSAAGTTLASPTASSGTKTGTSGASTSGASTSGAGTSGGGGASQVQGLKAADAIKLGQSQGLLDPKITNNTTALKAVGGYEGLAQKLGVNILRSDGSIAFKGTTAAPPPPAQTGTIPWSATSGQVTGRLDLLPGLERNTLAAQARTRADASGQPVTVAGVTFYPSYQRPNDIDVPDLSNKQLAAYTKLPALEDLVLRQTGLDNLTVSQRTALQNLIKTKSVNNYTIENLVNDWAPKLDEQPYLGLSSLPKELGGQGREPVFGEPPKGMTPTGEYIYDQQTGRYVPKDEDSNIYISDQVKTITKVSDLDPLTIALYGRKANLTDFAKYDSSKIGKYSLKDIYYDMKQSDDYQNFLSDQELAYINKFGATRGDIANAYRDLFGKAAPEELLSYYERQAMTPEQMRQELLNSPEYEQFLNKGLVPEIPEDKYKLEDLYPKYQPGPPVTPYGNINFTPQFTGQSAYDLKPLTREGGISALNAPVSAAFTTDYNKSPIQNALAQNFTPTSVFTLPAISVPNLTVGYAGGVTNPATSGTGSLVSPGTLTGGAAPSGSNMFAQNQPLISPFSPYASMTPDQVSKLSPEELQKYLAMMQTPVGSNIYSAGTYKPFQFAEGGMASGGYHLGDYSDGGRLLKGPGDGVSDSIPASIGNRQPARLADGEFVIPARIVSEIGNGSTDAGARKLYAMMDKIQKVRNKTVGKGKVAVDTKAEKYLPA